MTNIAQLLTEHIDIWTAADTEKKSGRGRASTNAGNVYGVKKLRELILELAVRGKLVPQDANDESASELLKRIQAEKAKLVAEGKIKKEKPLESIAEDEKFFELPNRWEWVRVGSLGNWGAGATPLRSVSSYYGGTMPWFKSGELIADFIDTAEETVTDLALKDCSLRLNQPGDVLLAMYGATIGKASILKIAGTTNQAVCACTPNASIFNRYLLLMLKAMKSNFVGQGAGGAQPNISREKIIATLTALPPLTEQHRIVAKVNELMALCDQLEQQHSNAQEAHETLVGQLLATLTQSQNAAEFNTNWQRIYVHFDVLFTTEASIDALKQTLLQLAVMGKLVPQDANDEPASELLNRIQAEKAELIAEGKLKKEKPLSQIVDDEKLFELPNGWKWVRLGYSLLKITDGTHHSPTNLDNGAFKYISAKNIKSWGLDLSNITYVTKDIHEEIYGRCDPEFGDVLYIKDGATTGIATINTLQEPFSMLSSVALLKPSVGTYNQFLLKAMTAPFFYAEMRSEMTGVAITRVTLAKLNNAVIPLPPLAEQQRIVAKVDELIALCDHLKTRIQQANQQKQFIADTLVTEALQPTAEIINLADYRVATACYAITKMQGKSYFGRTTAMKVLYLAEAHLGLPLNFQPMREAAGPLDKWIYTFEKQGEHEGWFKVIESEIRNGKTKIEYQVKPAIAQKSDLVEKICSGDQLKEFDRLLGLIADKTTEEAEIIATLFAAWNDFLIDGHTPSDDEIVKEVRENWHESKARFTPKNLKESLIWMRRNHLVPQGRPPRTVYQQQLITN